jgi:single-strand selective monofunctional uracil DNA glycosylase
LQFAERGTMNLQLIADALAKELEALTFSPPVSHVYNPLVYARKAGALYLGRYGEGPKEAVFLGMNPGPWGMAQTGVPFGEIAMVRDWLGIETEVDRPEHEHPKKKVEGFACRRSEVSGRRLWGLFRARFGEAERFFDRFLVLNYCPLLFLDGDGRNITPDKLKLSEREPLLAVCDQALRRAMVHVRPGCVIGIGGFAAERAEAALTGLNIRVGRILHPSPANPAANRNWEEQALRQLQEQGIIL